MYTRCAIVRAQPCSLIHRSPKLDETCLPRKSRARVRVYKWKFKEVDGLLSAKLKEKGFDQEKGGEFYRGNTESYW